MRTKLFLLALCLALGAAAVMFHIKYTVVALEQEHRHLIKRIDEEQNRIRTRKADLAFLMRPQRLAEHAKSLELRPAQGSRIILADQIGRRVDIDLANKQREITLPAGASGSLSLKPVMLFDLPELEESER